ncbi:hypothetical protein PISMIDRAFT_347463 [Pisolithus microcarpus 441]|uniref:Uncharacterized protein n=1 Tax=Pisolithus microcarpus 441 TaxID=765257 RepID=A0A0C9XQQ4_9AGAM|nr:hypothetical protein PISMIDRAFT_347463 [Pisolithus microcarpus 441]
MPMKVHALCMMKHFPWARIIWPQSSVGHSTRPHEYDSTRRAVYFLLVITHYMVQECSSDSLARCSTQTLPFVERPPAKGSGGITTGGAQKSTIVPAAIRVGVLSLCTNKQTFSLKMMILRRR